MARSSNLASKPANKPVGNPVSNPVSKPASNLTRGNPLPEAALPQQLRSPHPVIFEVIDGGLETTVQDDVGRAGYLQLGIPRSGPMDRQSFQLGNQILGNPHTAAGLEIQFVGPKLRFCVDTLIAVTGANNRPKINRNPVPMWRSLLVRPGDILSFGHAKVGARSYLQVAGGLDVPLVMGSRSTFIQAQLGGFQGRKLEQGDRLSALPSTLSDQQLIHRHLSQPDLPRDLIPTFSHCWELDILLGPHDRWLTEADIERVLSADWRISPKSNRVGYRLEGPAFEFSASAHHKAPENGEHPSNKIDYGCPVGAVLFCGQTPTILMADGPSLTGYMTPFTVVTASLWKVGQGRPGDRIIFRIVDLSQALANAHSL